MRQERTLSLHDSSLGTRISKCHSRSQEAAAPGIVSDRPHYLRPVRDSNSLDRDREMSTQPTDLSSLYLLVRGLGLTSGEH